MRNDKQKTPHACSNVGWEASQSNGVEWNEIEWNGIEWNRKE